MKSKVFLVQVDADLENADWIKTPENRASEAEIHRLLAEQYAAAQAIEMAGKLAPPAELPE